MWQFVDDALRLARPWAGKAMQAGKGLWSKAGPAGQKIIQTVGPGAAAGGVVGGVRGAQQGGIPGAITGGLGGAIGGTMTGAIPGVRGLNPIMQGAIGAGGGLYGPGILGATANTAGNVATQGAGAGVIQMQNQPKIDGSGGYIGGGSPVPNVGGEHGRMMIGPDGNIYEQVRADGYRQGARVGSGLDTMQNISNYNRWFNASFPQREMIRKADMEREIAAQQLRRNMDLAYNISNRAHQTTSNIAEQAAKDQGTLLNSNVRYF